MAEPLKLPIEQLRFNADGLIPAIAQDWLDGAVLMVAWMNRQALELTLPPARCTTGAAHARSFGTKVPPVAISRI